MDEEPLLVNRPQLPSFERLMRYGSVVDASRYYTNHGPMHERLRSLLAELFGVEESWVGLAASGNTALSALLQAAAGRARVIKPLCVCSAFTFVATGAAAVECGYTPYIADIDPETWALDPTQIERLPLLQEVGAVIVTAPMGRMVDLAAWQAFSDRTRIPVVVDAAAGFDTLDPGALRAVRIPVMISLHATKTFSTAEGGLMLCADPELIHRAVASVNFGFEEDRISMRHGVNGKMSEYHAIIGLCEMETWADKRDRFRRVGASYLEQARTLELDPQIIADGDHALPYVHYLAETADEATQVTSALDIARIGWRCWYGLGLRSHPAFNESPAVALPQAESLMARLISLPMAVDMTPQDVQRTLETIRRTFHNY